MYTRAVQKEAAKSEIVGAETEGPSHSNFAGRQYYENGAPVVVNGRQQNGVGNSQQNFEIPRVRSRQQPLTTVHNNKENGIAQKKRQKNFDTFGENAIERIYDEFRFLDEPNTCPSPSSSSARPILCTDGKERMRVTPSLVAYCILPLVQLFVSIALLVFGAVRYYELFQEENISNLLLDLNKPEDFAGTTLEGAKVIKARTGTSILLPSILQCIGALFGFWPLARKRAAAFQTLHILFSSLSILLWFGVLPNVAIELNLYFVQMERLYESSDYYVFAALICLSYFEVLLLPTITIGIASFHLVPMARRRKGVILSVSSSIATVLLAATAVCFAAYAASRSLWNLDDWPSSNLVNPGALYAYGLTECIVAGYILVCSFLFFLSNTVRTTGLLITGMVLQGVCILSLCMYVITADRLLSVSHNAKVLSAERKTFPVSHVNLILLYSTLICLLGSLLFQFILSTFQMSTVVSSTRPPSVASSPQQRTVF